MLRVAIDARMIRYSGIGTYIRSLLDEYRKIPSAGEFSIFGDPSELEEYQAFNVRKLTVPIYSIAEQLLLPLKTGTAAIYYPSQVSGISPFEKSSSLCKIHVEGSSEESGEVHNKLREYES
jgi:hypothetical protein